MRIVINKKRFVTVVGTGILLIIAVIVCVASLKNTDNENTKGMTQTDNNTSKTEITKQDFLDEYNQISNSISQKLLDGSVYDNETLTLAVAKYNKILESTNWSQLRT